MKIPYLAPSVCVGLFSFGCQTPLGENNESSSAANDISVSRDVVPDVVSAQLPLDVDDEHESILAYLTDRYDADADGRVSKSEYDREDRSFERLDRNDDGVIDPADFERSGGGMAARMSAMMAQTLVALYFQTDEEPNELSLSELEGAVAIFDSNGDGAIDPAEFDALATERKALGLKPSGMIARRLEDVDHWESVARGIDSDQDGLLEQGEVIGFFKARDSNADQVWSFNSAGGGGGAGRAAASSSGPAAGELAPDFSLETHHGNETVRLSDFRGEKPVALIFGSYT